MRKDRLVWIGGRDSTREALHAALARLARLELVKRPWLEPLARLEPELLSGAVLVVGEPRSPGEVTRFSRLAEQLSRMARPVPCLALAPVYLAEDAIRLFRSGVAEYIESRAPEAELIRVLERLALDLGASRCLPTALEVDQLIEATTLTLPGMSPALKDQLRRISGQETTILLTGESGTGRSRLAELIHEWSPRRGQPFVVVHCAEFRDDDFEVEVFGAARGSFPGLAVDLPGRLAEAGRGTILFEGIESLSQPLQARLLRVVEDRLYEPIGSDESQPLQARLIASSSISLEDEARAGRFRADLFYRLNVVGFRLPPLRERRAAIQDLVFKFLSESAVPGPLTISPEALRRLEQYGWPGNIRELRAVVDRAAATAHNRRITVENLPLSIAAGQPDAPDPSNASSSHDPVSSRSGSTMEPESGPQSLTQTRENAEIARIMRALEQEQHNRMRTARALGISRVTLYKKLEKYGLLRKERAIIDG